jgi:NAD(P)-dependent dehydrogenase (short-subunit alcohol dehydrogenase family)
VGRLEGKVAVVTGAAMGIGKAAAVAMAREGARVALGDINDEVGEATAREIKASGGEAFFLHADVSSTSEVRALVEETVKRYGRLDILVNNAAVAISGTVVDIKEDDWNRVLNTNLTSVWRGMKFAVPHIIKAGGGSIINVASVQGRRQGWC